MSGFGRGLVLTLVLVIAAVMMSPGVSAMTVGAPGGGSASHAATNTASSSSRTVSPASTAGLISSPSASSTASSNAPVEGKVLGALKTSNAPMSEVFLPNFDPTVAVTNGVVSPLYTSSPAPMGLGDFGIQEVHGQNVGTISYTSSVEAAVTLNTVEPLYLGAAGPDQFTIQENTVLTNVDVLGSTANDYWIQNVPVYYASSDLLVFEDNIWNFSNPYFDFPANGIYAHGPLGAVYGNEVYIGIGLQSYTIAPPFTITTYNNATVYNDRPTVFFNYTLTNSTMSVSGSYDFAEFNSTGVATPTGPSPSPTYQINGESANPTGFLLNDAEIMLGGPGGGSETNLENIAGSFGLWTLPNGSATYKDVPSAYDFGTDTGETSAGIAEWSSGGSNPVADIASGPSLLYPLWGIKGSVKAGAVEQSVAVNPSNAFIFVSQGSPFNSSAAGWAPVPASGYATYWLPPGTYSYDVLMSEYKPVKLTLFGDAAVSLNLAWDPALGVYTPLWAFGNAQLAGISQSGIGTISDPYVLYNNQVGLINPLFGQFNDYLFPVFTGILLAGTTAYVAVYDAPSFEFAYTIQPEAAVVAEEGLPTANYLEQGYIDVEHVSIVDTPLITGWIFADDTGFTEASVVFWYSSNNLVAGNTFQVMSDGLIFFGGTQNTVWGNVFEPVAAAAPNPGAVGYYGYQFGLILWESGDLIYNNAWLTPVTAWTPTYNIYTGGAALYVDRWYVQPQPASNVRVVNGWELSGSILGLSYVAGNYWSNYGSQEDPYHVLPYNDGGAITVNGDYHPLLPFLLYTVEFKEKGLPSGTEWSVTLNGITLSSTSKELTFWDPSGLYAFAIPTTSGYTPTPATGAVTVASADQTVSVTWSS